MFERFEIPNSKDCNDMKGNTNKLIQNNQWCYVPCDIEVVKGDILIGMTVNYGNSSKNTINQSIYTKNKTNISAIYDQKWPAIVHSLQCGINGDGYMYIRLVTRQYRKPVL